MEVIRRLRRSLRSYVPGFGDPLPKRPRRITDSLVSGGADGEAVVRSLIEAGVLVQRGEEVVLSTGFREQWRTEMETLAGLDGDRFAAAIADVAPGVEDARVVTDRGREFVVVSDGDEPLWLSRPVAIAEVAALRALEGAVPADRREAAARPLRLFLDECPDCGGRVGEADADLWPGTSNLDDDVEELLVCWDCGERLYTF